MQRSLTTVTSEEIPALLHDLGEEFVVVKNPGYIYSAFDVYPLAAKITEPRDRIVGIVQDMDGTTTTTETLCLHSLEYMIRQITGQLTWDEWTGLDRDRDYPHIIGNSTTRHIEYLIQTYQGKIDENSLCKAYLRAALWTLASSKDQRRKREVLVNLRHFGCNHLLREKAVDSWLASSVDSESSLSKEVEDLIIVTAPAIQIQEFSDKVRAAIDIYYRRYHEILGKIEVGSTDELDGISIEAGRRLIEPMPGVAVFLATVKGWLGEDSGLFFDELCASLPVDLNSCPRGDTLLSQRNKLRSVGSYFQAYPANIAVVTSSIEYEANIVLTEVFRLLQEQVAAWPVAEAKRERLLEKFSSYKNVFDSVITASDSSEIRLKPHRDLYSLALHQLGIPKEDFDKIIGFEDSESGAVAIRAAGIGLCVAVPFADTQGHQLDYASFVLQGGLPEALLVYHLFLSDNALMEFV